ncbi:hypothetical protein CL622_07475, partial [archaeon]|nr:hypothetical protein [archaeon]
MAFANTLNIPYTVYGGLSTGANGGVNTLSGFTCELTKFRFIPTLTDPVFDYISSDNFVWDFGDGTISKAASADHVYHYPGVYTVSLVAYDSAGNEQLSTNVKQLSVTDFYPDRLLLSATDVTTTINIPSNISNASKVPITIERRSTNRLHRALSADEYTVNLYASGSNSFDRSTMLDDKWLHLDKTWSFYKSSTADNGEEVLTGVTSIDTTTEKIYYRLYEKFQTQWIDRVALSALDSTPDAVFVGTSGIGSFLYGDTLPKVSDQPVFVFCSLDTTKVPDYRDLLQGVTYRKLHDQDLTLPSLYNKLELVIPMRVRYRTAKSLTFTAAGMKNIPFSSIKWQSVKAPFFVDLVDGDGNITANYADLSGRQAVSGAPPDTTTFVTSLSVISGDSTELSTCTATTLLSAHFYRNDEMSLPHSIDSKFSGLMTPYVTGENVYLVGSVELYSEPSFQKDAVLFGIINKDTLEYTIGHLKDIYINDEFSVSVDSDLGFTTHTL